NYSLNFDSVSLDSTANNTATRQFELTDSLMSVSVSKPTSSLIFGTRNFMGNPPSVYDLKIANICELVNSDTVTSATALIQGTGTSTSQAGALIFFTLETSDPTSGLPGGQAAVVLETDLYTLTATDVSRGRVTIPFPASVGGSPQERVVQPGDYWLVANLFSNNGANHISLLDDQTVTMPWFASVLFRQTDWFTNGNAVRMSLNFGRVPRVPGASVADLNEFAAIAYPNPTADLLNIKLSAVRELGKVQTSLFDMTGRLVRSDVTEANGQSARFTLDLASIPNGTYYLDVLSDAGSKRQRVIVRH
ncbi:MAG: T9SS type A sorting domain-containing protein, partial [Bacteroidota bacterium]